MYGVLSDRNMPQGLLLDTIRHVETGGSPNPNYAMGSASELGSMQFRTDMLHDLGYGMPRNIDPFNLMDPDFSRNLADQFIKGYSKHHSFDTPIEKLIAYNMGAQGAADWKARGSNFDELPQKTKDYIRKSAAYLNDMQPNQENNLPDQTEESKDMINNGNLQNKNATTYPPVYPVADSELADIYGGVNKTLDTLENTPQDVAVAIKPTQFTQEDYNDMGYVEPVLIRQPINPNTSSAVLTSPGDQPSSMFMSPAYAATLTGDEENLRQGVLSQQNTSPVMNTDQARKQTPFSLPDQRIGRDEALIRIGGAMMGGSQQGGLAALNAATNQYGSIQDYNRSQALDAYNAAVEAAGSRSNTDDETLQQIGQIDQTMFDMNRAKEYLNKGGITGLIEGTFGAGIDKIFGNAEKVSGRLLLEKLRVDDTLLRIAQTKGAISNKEMDLFLAPTPKITDTEQVWLQWIDDRQQAITRVRQRLAGGQTVAQGEQASSAQVNQYGSGVGSSSTYLDIGQSTEMNGSTVTRTK